MKVIRATAPGKLVVVGEYAVLQGGPAIVSAVDRRAVAEFVGSESIALSELRISNDGRRYRFEIHKGSVQWRDNPGEQGALLEAAVQEFADRGLDIASLAPFSLQLCSQSFYADGSRKLGLGSSAAVAVALTGCLQQAISGVTDCDTALAVHRKFQRNSGSGIDVCASYHGGNQAVRNGEVTALVWPPEVFRLPVWTGVTASTPLMLSALAKFAAEQPQQHNDLLSVLSAHAGGAVHACEQSDAAMLQAALRDFSVALHELDAATGLGIWSAEHLELERLAAQAGLSYKPSGAGGGDFGLAIGTDPEAALKFRALVAEAGFACVDFEWGVDGLTLD